MGKFLAFLLGTPSIGFVAIIQHGKYESESFPANS
jgi:hypothetical protein